MQKSVKFTTFPIESQTCMAYATSISLLNLVSEMVNVTRHSFNTSLSRSTLPSFSQRFTDHLKALDYDTTLTTDGNLQRGIKCNANKVGAIRRRDGG